jgi:hypothetical protein
MAGRPTICIALLPCRHCPTGSYRCSQGGVEDVCHASVRARAVLRVQRKVPGYGKWWRPTDDNRHDYESTTKQIFFEERKGRNGWWCAAGGRATEAI